MRSTPPACGNFSLGQEFASPTLSEVWGAS
jgi:hypothetical protein